MEILTLKKMQELLDEINLEIQSLMVPATSANIKNLQEAIWRVNVVSNTVKHQIAEMEKGEEDGTAKKADIQ